MAKNAYVRLTLAALLLAGLGSASACGSSEEDDNGSATAGTGGGSGSGGMVANSEPIECGTEQCNALVLPIPGAPPVAACCAADDACGLDSSVLEAFGPTFAERCQVRDQPGVLDSDCPNSTSTTLEAGITLEFQGCCRTDVGKCGYMLDTLFGQFDIGLGCVDSEPFLEGGTAPACGSGAGGAGAGGAAAGGAAAGGAAAGGASAGGASAGGAGGATSPAGASGSPSAGVGGV